MSKEEFETPRADQIKQKIAELRKANPKLKSFLAAWNQLQRESPSLFTDVPDKEQMHLPTNWGSFPGRVSGARRLM